MTYSPLSIEIIKLLGSKELSEQVTAELKKVLQWHYSCSRVWEAWQYWTMTQSDFYPLEEDENIYEDIFSLFSLPTLEDLFIKAEEKGIQLRIIRDEWYNYMSLYIPENGINKESFNNIPYNPKLKPYQQTEETMEKILTLFK